MLGRVFLLWQHGRRGSGRADPPWSADFDPEGEGVMKCDFLENFLSRAETIHAAGDNWAGRGGPALPGVARRELFIR